MTELDAACLPLEHQRVRAALRACPVQALADEGRRRAAVALVITEVGPGGAVPGLPTYPTWNASAAVLLTRRASSMRAHAGQWALPGGRMDAGETPEQTALRELHEEVGLQLDPAAVLGRLDDYATRSGYVITPVVVWGGPAREAVPNLQEVASIHRLPTSELLREDAPLLNQVRGAEYPVLRMPVGQAWIAAPTAALLYQFREWVLCDRPTRVAHFDQPHFAWR